MFVLTPNSQNLMSTPRTQVKRLIAPKMRVTSEGSRGGQDGTTADLGGSKVQQGTRKKRRYAPPFTRAVYKLFINAVKNPAHELPSVEVLSRNLFVMVGSKSLRQRFRDTVPKFEVKAVDGTLVFSENETEEVLISKLSKKIILPIEDIPRVILRAHLHMSDTYDSLDSLQPVYEIHASIQDTYEYLKEDFATTRREFGIDWRMVKRFVDNCPKCLRVPSNETDDDRYVDMALRDVKDVYDKMSSGANSKDTPSVRVIKTPTTATNLAATKLTSPTSKLATIKTTTPNLATTKLAAPNVATPNLATPNLATTFSQVQSPQPTKQNKPSSEHRFASMVAKVPHEKCIWYNRENIAAVDNKFEKLLLLLIEIKGEMALSFKGDNAAKIRLDTKIYVARLLISEYLKCLAHNLRYNDKDIEQVKGQLFSLQKEYALAGQTTLFLPDLRRIVDKNDINVPELVIGHFRTFMDNLGSKEKNYPKENMEVESALLDTTKHVLECL